MVARSSTIAPRCLTLVASDVAPIGGMEGVAFELASRLLARGWELTVLARSCALSPQPRLRFVRLLSPSRPVSAALLGDFLHASLILRHHARGLVQTNNAIIANRVDVINVHFCEAAYQARVGTSRSRRASLPYRVNSFLVSAWERGMERWCYRPGRVRALACVSRGVEGEIRTYHPVVAGRTRVISNGVDRARFAVDPGEREAARRELGLAETERVALFVGGDWQRKGLRHAVEGIAGTQDWSLVVVGAGDADGFAALARRHGAGERVRFEGRRPDPRPYYAAADVLLFPSSYEAFSLVTLEACAAGLPLIVPRLNGTEELVRDGVNGWFTEARGASIAARLDALTADPQQLATARVAAREASEGYDWEDIVDRYEALYAELAAETAARVA